MHILLYFIFCSLYLIFYSFYFMHTSLVLYSTIFALSMERTWLTFHCWLYNLCIVVYVTNKTWTWTWTRVAGAADAGRRAAGTGWASAVKLRHILSGWQSVYYLLFTSLSGESVRPADLHIIIIPLTVTVVRIRLRTRSASSVWCPTPERIIHFKRFFVMIQLNRLEIPLKSTLLLTPK